MYLEPIKIELVAQRISEMKGAASPPRRRSRPRAPTGWPRPSWTPVSTSSSSRGRRLGGTRLEDRRAAQPEEVHPRVRIAGDRRRLRELPGRTAPHAHRRRRCARGRGPGNACTSRAVLGIGVPQATAIADVAGARMRHLDETGVYVHVIADGGMSRGGDIAKPSPAAPTP